MLDPIVRTITCAFLLYDMMRLFRFFSPNGAILIGISQTGELFFKLSTEVSRVKMARLCHEKVVQI